MSPAWSEAPVASPVTSKLIEPLSSASVMVNQTVSSTAEVVHPLAEKLPSRRPSPGAEASVSGSFT